MIKTRHLLDLDDADRPFIEALIARAQKFKTGVPNAAVRLRDRVIVGMFFEPSTRTNLSFQTAAKRLGASWIEFHAPTSSLAKGESLEDTMRTLRATGADAVVVRHSEAGFPHALARHFDGSVFNAGDGAHAHPTQGLTDAMTLVEEFGDLAGKQVVICGDVRHSRVARSSGRAAWLLGARVTLCGPPLLLPPQELGWGFAQLTTDIAAALAQADAVMLLRIQRERASGEDMPPPLDLAQAFGLTADREKLLPAHAVVMHPGPVNRGLELDERLVTSERSRIERQVENGVYVRMACLEHFMSAAARERVA